VRRREFITLLGGAAAWPLAARAQQADRMRRIGALMNLSLADAESQTRTAAFLQALQRLGWTQGRNMHIDYRWAGAEAKRFQPYAAELVALAPDVILAYASPAVAALQQTTRTVPVVFTSVIDPVGAGFVESLARPGDNVTGFTLFEYSISAKWLELLKQIAPGMTRAAVIRDPALAAGIGQFAAIQTVAPSLGVELSAVNVRNAGEIASAPSRALRARRMTAQRDLIIDLAGRYRLPAVYPFRFYVAGGGLMSYGPDQIDQLPRAAGYVDRILKGENPAELPVQNPTKYELIINLKTAKALGLEVSPTLLARADEVIE
jgi:putative ABC transport system substrate-binding protein